MDHPLIGKYMITTSVHTTILYIPVLLNAITILRKTIPHQIAHKGQDVYYGDVLWVTSLAATVMSVQQKAPTMLLNSAKQEVAFSKPLTPTCLCDILCQG